MYQMVSKKKKICQRIRPIYLRASDPWVLLIRYDPFLRRPRTFLFDYCILIRLDVSFRLTDLLNIHPPPPRKRKG